MFRTLQFTKVKDSRSMSPDCTSVALTVNSTRASSRWADAGATSPATNSSDHNQPRRAAEGGMSPIFFNGP